VQDSPGRAKLWHIGVPPSGPMDSLSLRFANALVGNNPDAAGLEITLNGPKLRFHRAAKFAVCGGDFPVTIGKGPSKRDVEMWTTISVKAGEQVAIGAAKAGARCYLAVDGGFDAPIYLSSRSTFPGGNLGGYQGRPLLVRSTVS
jgi:allophanate hydrolase subunit 2